MLQFTEMRIKLTDYRLALMTGVDIPIPELQLVLHQPSIKEISMLGEKDFFIALQFLCLHKSNYIKDEFLLQQYTNFDIFIEVLMDKNVAQEFSNTLDLKNSIRSLLALLFGDYQVLFTPQSLILNSNENKDISVIIDQNNFDIMQEKLRAVFCLNTNILGEQGVFNPKGSKAREIAEKIMRGRQRVAAQKGDSNESVFVRYLSILTIGVPMSLQDAINCTVYQIYDLIERYSLLLDWDIDLKVRLAGGTPNSQAESFMKNIHEG